MSSLIQNTFGALIGIFLALLFVSYVDVGLPEKKESQTEPSSVSFQSILPKSAALLTEGIDTELLKEIPATDAAQVAANASAEMAVLPDTSPKKETQEPAEKADAIATNTEKTPPLLSASELNTLARNATVNIFCMLDGNAASGSGVVIDERGIILTNAHIAQYFLLDTRDGEEFVTCTIRTGSPAKAAFKGELLYLPSQWIDEHAVEINKDAVSATGEYDYALVRAVPFPGTATTSFPALPPAYGGAGLLRGESVLVASYPAGFLGAESLQKNLWLISSFSEIKELYNFPSSASGIIDVFSVHGVVGAQEGSSGGAVVRAADGKLLGVVVTRSNGETTGDRDLFSLGIPYINEGFSFDIQKTLAEFLASDIEAYQAWFDANVKPRLKERLFEEIEQG